MNRLFVSYIWSVIHAVGAASFSLYPEQTPLMPLDTDQLNPTDQVILDHLQEGRCTAAYISQESGYSKGNIRNRLGRLVEHGHVKNLGGGLYEVVSDPRDD